MDYVLQIQTLLALQEQGLTSLPHKTWAEIASYEEQKGRKYEFNTLYIFFFKNTQTSCKPKNKIKKSKPVPTIQPQNLKLTTFQRMNFVYYPS